MARLGFLYRLDWRRICMERLVQLLSMLESMMDFNERLEFKFFDVTVQKVTFGS